MAADAKPDDEERWAQAESILAGAPSADAQRRSSRRRNRTFLTIGGSGVLGAALGLVIGLLVPHRHDHRHAVTGWPGVAGLVLTSCGVLVEIAAIVVLIRRGGWGWSWRSPTAVLTRRQRRSLFQQIRGRRPVDPGRVTLARYVAARLDEQVRLLFPIFLGNALIAAGNVLTTRDEFHYWLAGYWLVLIVVTSPLWGRQRRQARRFLEEHPAPEE